MAIALVTGTNTGIGLATAVTLGRAGHTVFSAMRNIANAGELQRIVAAEQLPVTTLALDVDDDASVNSAIGQVILQNGQIDVLVNNAGISGGGPVEEAPVELFQQVMETNFFGGLRCIKAVLPGMRARRHGCIINITSVAGRFGLAAQAPYAASKWAFEAFSECLAQEVSPFNVRVAIVEPGVIATPINTKPRPPVPDSAYPHRRRLRAFIDASLKNLVSPYVVADCIRQIAEGDSWQLRYPIGPDAVPLIQWRSGMSDEEWVKLGTVSDSEWAVELKQKLGLDVFL